MVCYQGKNAEGEDCIFIKIRRAVKYDGFDLRKAEDQIKEKYGDTYMGGGGHAGAVSFRVQPQDEKKFLAKVNKVFDFIKDNFN